MRVLFVCPFTPFLSWSQQISANSKFDIVVFTKNFMLNIILVCIGVI
jgi:hypothetical protein